MSCGRLLRDEAALLGVELSHDTATQLEAFERLLMERAVPLGHVGGTDAGRIQERHVLDSLRAVRAVEPDDRLAIDIGSGAGLPGVVVAAVLPGLRLVLVESRRSRVAFLELVLERLGLENATVLHGRIEDVEVKADVCFARAFAPIEQAWRAAMPRLRPGGRLAYFAGRGAGIPSAVPGASDVRPLEAPVVESSGPLIIMTR